MVKMVLKRVKNGLEIKEKGLENERT